MRRILYIISVFVILGSVLWADTYFEDFNDLSSCDMPFTSGGWNVADSVGTVAMKPPQQLSWGDATGQTQKADVKGDYIYTADIDGIAKFSLTSGSQTDHYTTTGSAVDIMVSGEYGFVASSGRFYSTLLSDLEDATSYFLSVNAYGLDILRDSAYVGGGSDGLRCIDINDPTSMQDRGTCTSWGGSKDARGVAICSKDASDYAVVADAFYGVVHIKISGGFGNPHVTNLEEGGYYVAARDTMAVLAAGDSIYVLGLGNIDADTDLNVLARLKSRDNAYDVEFINDSIFVVADGTYGMDIFRICGDDAGRVYLLCSAPLDASGDAAKGVKIDFLNNNAVVCDDDGIQILKLPPGGIGPASEWADVFDVAAGWPAGEAIGLEYSNGYVIASNQSHGIVSIDVGTPTDMVFGDEIKDYSASALTPALGMDIDGTDLYLCCASRASENFFQVDVSDPTNMSVSGAWNIPYSTYNVDVSGGYAYIGHSGGVHKCQISPWALSDSLIDDEESYSIIVDGSYVYVAHWNLGLYVLDVSDLDPPVATMGLAGKANDIAKNGDYLYVAAGTGGLYKIDVSDPGTGIDSLWHQDTINGYPNSVSMYGDYVVVGLLESPSGQDLRVYSEAGNLVYVCPSSPPPTHIGQETVVVGNYVFMSDYFEGVKAWHVGNFKMDSLNQATTLHSNKINETDDFQYVHWEAFGEVADSTVVLDTAYFYIAYGDAVDNLDTFRIMQNHLDPPDNIDGSPGYHNLLNQYDYLYWFGEISSHIDVAFPHWHDSTDTAWSIDSIKVLYSGSPAALLRTVGSIELEVGELVAELSVIFDEGAEIGTDSLDVPSLPDDPARWLLNGNEYRTISLPYGEPAFGLQLEIDAAAQITSMSLDGATVYIDGEAAYDEMLIADGTHPAYAGPPWVYRYPMPFKIGWNMIALPGTVPVSAELFPADQMFSYNPIIGNYVIAEDLMPGKGYFCFANENYAFYDGVSIERMDLVLEEGWNLVGGTSETVSVDALNTSPANAILPYCIFSLIPGSYAYYPVEVLEPRFGYWIFALAPCTLSIGDGDDGLKKLRRRRPRAQARMPLALWSGTVRQTLVLGMAEKSTAGFDAGLDEPMPPVLPLQPILGYFSYDGPGGKLMTDVRPEEDEWHLVILKPTNLMLKSDYRMGGICIMGDNTSVSIFSTQSTALQSGTYRILWQESQFGAIPTRTILKNAFPNPFNATLEIDIELAEDNGELEILDLLGRSVHMFELSGKGVHHIKWNAQTSLGKEMPSGVYFVSLRTDETAARRKVLLVK